MGQKLAPLLLQFSQQISRVPDPLICKGPGLERTSSDPPLTPRTASYDTWIVWQHSFSLSEGEAAARRVAARFEECFATEIEARKYQGCGS